MLLLPVSALAQSTPKAGIVTTLEGSVTARRVALPDPVPLKFKDDVFLQDTVTTGDKALARMLLGGKAVVTVRERTALTITEIPGKTTIELGSGKFALAVAREKMRPGEEILIRTPNAVAGLRGTVVIAEVVRQGAQAGGPAPAVQTNFYVLRGTISTQPLNPGTGLSIGPSLTLGAMQRYFAAGAAVPRVESISQDQVGQITSGLQPSGPKGGGEAAQEQAKAQAVDTAVQLMAALTGENQVAAVTAGPASAGIGSTLQPSQTAPIHPIPPGSEFHSGACDGPSPGPTCTSSIVSAPQPPQPPVNPPQNLPSETPPTNQTQSPPSETPPPPPPPTGFLLKFVGPNVLTATDPAATLTNGAITGSTEDLISATPGALVTTAGPLANIVNSDFATSGAFVGINTSTVTSTTTQPLISFDPVTGTFGDSFVYVRNGTLQIAGPLFVDAGGSLALAANLVEFRNSTVSGSGTDPLVQLTGTTVTGTASPARTVFFIDGDGLPVTLGGPLLQATGGTTFTGGLNFVFIGDSAVSSTSSDAFLQLTNTTVNGASNFVAVDGLAQGTSPTSLSLQGPLLVAADSAITQRGNLLRIAEGASVASTTTAPLVSIDGGSFTGGGPVNTASGGSLLRMFSQTGRPGSTLTLAGPYANIANATIVTTDSDTFNLADGSTIISTTTSPFASFTSSLVVTAFNFFDLQTNTSFGTPLTVGNGGPVAMSINGSLVDAVDTFFLVQNGSFFRMRNGVSLTQTGSSPLLRLIGTGDSVSIAEATANFAVLSSGAPASPQLTLGGQFLVAQNALLTSGDPSSNTNSFFFIGDGSQVTSSTSLPFLSLESSILDTAGNILDLRRSRAGTPTRLVLSGPLFSAVDSALDYTSAAFGSACCNGFFISQGAQLISSTTQPLIELISSVVTGADGQSGGNFFLITDTFTGAPAGDLVAPAAVILNGPLLQATNSSINTLFDLVSVTRASLSSTTSAPLLNLSGSTLLLGGVDPFTDGVTFGDVLGMFSSGVSAATVSLAGPLLSATNSSITGGSIVNIVNLANGATLTSTTTQPLVQLNGTVLSTSRGPFVNSGFSVFGAASCPSTGCVGVNADGTFATMNLYGPLLSAFNGASVNTSSDLVFVGNGGQIIVNGSTDPLISLTGGTHAIASQVLSGGFNSPIFDLRGRSTATAPEIADGVSLTLGTDRPIQHGGGLLETTGATVTSRQGLRVDTALLEASAPILHLKSGSSLTSAADGFDLVQKAKLTSIGSVVKLDASTLTINSGALALVRNGSFLKVTGDFLQLSNGSVLNLLNGAVLNVSGNSVVNISGAFVNFGGAGGNAVNVTNNLCAAGCTSIGGLNVNLTGGATAGNVSITNAVKNPGLGSINLSNPSNTAVISVSGASSKVTISGN